MTSYTTIQGDMWDSIAHKVYGNAALMKELIEANPKWRHQYTFPAGVVLDVPDVTEVVTDADMPPWKRVSE